ncbi:Deoxyribose-phosphate aldolase [Candidatus Hepatincolaceae symbiont of Richtersius coronifer]
MGNIYTAAQILSLIDLTLLNENDNEENIKDLCTQSSNPLGKVAAICIFPQFIATAQAAFKELKNQRRFLSPNLEKPIAIATVINFPQGEYNLTNTLQELDFALKAGADEIDMVMPYQLLFSGDNLMAEDFIKEIKDHCQEKILKVIIESGELDEELTRTASKIVINTGANFIKTSTGKVKINATLDAAKYILEEIHKSKSKCGFKASGGIRTKAEAVKYLDLASKIMGNDFINPSTFRFGASALVDNLLATNPVEKKDKLLNY